MIPVFFNIERAFRVDHFFVGGQTGGLYYAHFCRMGSFAIQAAMKPITAVPA